MALAVEANRAVSQALRATDRGAGEATQGTGELAARVSPAQDGAGHRRDAGDHDHARDGIDQRFAQVGNFSSYCRCVDSLRESNGKKKGEGNTKNGNKYLAWAFVEAANFALRYCPQAKSFYDRKKSKTNRIVGDQGAGAQAGAGVLPHAARAEALRCAPVFRVTVWPKAVSQESGLV